MFRKSAIGLILGLALVLSVPAAPVPPPTADKTVGYALIDKLNRSFQDMAQKGTGGTDVVEKVLVGLMKDAKQARKDDKIDAVFFQRYSRVLRILYTAVLKDPDQTGILMPLIEREMAAFVSDMTGEKWSAEGKENIGQLAWAASQAIIELHLYLDTLDQRQQILKSFEVKYGYDPNKKKD